MKIVLIGIVIIVIVIVAVLYFKDKKPWDF